MDEVKLFDDDRWVEAPKPKAALRCTIRVNWYEDEGLIVAGEWFALDDLAGRWYRTEMTGKSHVDVYTAREIVLDYLDRLVRQTPPF
jgi:hypothetical protein